MPEDETEVAVGPVSCHLQLAARGVGQFVGFARGGGRHLAGLGVEMRNGEEKEAVRFEEEPWLSRLNTYKSRSSWDGGVALLITNPDTDAQFGLWRLHIDSWSTSCGWFQPLITLLDLISDGCLYITKVHNYCKGMVAPNPSAEFLKQKRWRSLPRFAMYRVYYKLDFPSFPLNH